MCSTQVLGKSDIYSIWQKCTKVLRKYGIYSAWHMSELNRVFDSWGVLPVSLADY